MSNNSGISKGTLLLLGGAAALLMSPASRKTVIHAASDALDNAYVLFDETVKPVAKDVAARASDLTDEARKRALVVQDDLQDYLAELQEEVDNRRQTLLQETEDTRRQMSKKAQYAKKDAHRSLQGLLGTAEEFVDENRRQLSKKANQAQKEARKSWMSLQKDAHHKVQTLDKTTRKQLSDYQKEIARLEKQLAKQAVRRDSPLQLASVRRKDNSGNSGSVLGAVVPLVLLAGAGAVVMVPNIRNSVADALEGVSPEAASYLRKAGKMVGSLWIEDMPPYATPSPASKPAQANASAAAGTPSPDAPAAIKTPAAAEPADAKPGDVQPADTSKPEDKK